VPTARPRHTITETDDVAEALDIAAQRWPEDRGARQRLLLRLVRAGRDALSSQQDKVAADRGRAIARTSGALSGVYRVDELERLRDDWPA